MKNDNKGFSLLELIIAFTLLSIVSSILLGFMVTSSNMYRNISGNISVQMQSQATAAQLKEYVIDCNNTVYYAAGDPETVLTVRNIDTDHVFVWNKNDQTITYNNDLLASNVSDFAVEYSGGTVQMLLTLERYGKDHTVTQVINLRNASAVFKGEAAPDRT